MVSLLVECLVDKIFSGPSFLCGGAEVSGLLGHMLQAVSGL